MPSDQREFPDLAPIRPQGARERDLRMQQGQGGPQLQSPQQGGGYGAYPGNAPAGGGQYGRYGQNAGGGQGAGGQYASRHSSGGYPTQQPAAEYPTQQYQTPQYQGQSRPQERLEAFDEPRPQQPRQSPRPPRKEEETPSWAEPDSHEEFAERWRRRGREAKQEEDQLKRRKKRRLLIGGAVVVAIAVGVTVDLTQGGPGASTLGFGNFVSNFLPGELQNVPNPCDTMPASMLSQDIPGKPAVSQPPMNSGLQTECTWTLDSPGTHTYRVLDIQYVGYSPSGLASGNGSATFAAQDGLAADQKGYTFNATLQKNTPGLKSSSATQVAPLPGIDGAFGFTATQVAVNNGLTQNLAYDYIRYRNVIVRVEVQGNSGTSGSKSYQASMSELTPIAESVAKQMASQIVQK